MKHHRCEHRRSCSHCYAVSSQRCAFVQNGDFLPLSTLCAGGFRGFATVDVLPAVQWLIEEAGAIPFPPGCGEFEVSLRLCHCVRTLRQLLGTIVCDMCKNQNPLNLALNTNKASVVEYLLQERFSPVAPDELTLPTESRVSGIAARRQAVGARALSHALRNGSLELLSLLRKHLSVVFVSCVEQHIRLETRILTDLLLSFVHHANG